MGLANYNQLEAAFASLRKFIDEAGYGRLVSDEHCREVSTIVAEAVLAVPSSPPQNDGQ